MKNSTIVTCIATKDRHNRSYYIKAGWLYYMYNIQAYFIAIPNSCITSTRSHGEIFKMLYRVKALLFVVILLSLSLLNISESPSIQTVQAAAPTSLIKWGYYVRQNNSLDSVRQNLSSLNVIAPYYYNLDTNGNIGGVDQPEVTRLAKSFGVKVIPMVKNSPGYDDFHKILADPNIVKHIIDQIDNLVTYNGYDGFNIDWEEVSASDRPLLTSFMAQLYAKLHPKGKLVTEALVAKSHDVTSGFGGSYDYTALSSYLDMAVIMTYDYSYPGGHDGPVSPISWVQSVMAYATSQFGPGKVLMGMPFYGYDWNLNQGGLAQGVTYQGIMDNIKQNNGTIGYDDNFQEPFADYTSNNDHHRVWFENPRSISVKLDLMKRNNLGGFAIWRLGQENLDFWPVIRLMNLPTQSIKAFNSTTDATYFDATGHSLGNVHHFLSYWKAHGGLAQFGYPQTEEFEELNVADGHTYYVQYFERARFEYHPEFAGTSNEVELGLLGMQQTKELSNEAPFQPAAPFSSTKTSYYFPQTKHSLSYGFLTYWLQHGGLALYGYPISEEFQEINPEDGKSYTVQYFERNRFEYHPELAGTKYETELGLLGNQMLRDRTWLVR